MHPKPLAASLVLAATLVTVAACSSGGSSSTTPTDKSSASSTTTSSKLVRQKGKDSIGNVFAKTSKGVRVSLSAAAPGHEVMAQLRQPNATTWSPPASVYKDTERFCHTIKLKGTGDILAATVACSVSAQDKRGTTSSYVLASTDGKTWKRSDLSGAKRKPSISPAGRYVSWSAPASFLLWSPSGSFTNVKFTQDPKSPTVGVTQDDGTVLLIKATAGKKKTCTISFQSISAKAPTPKSLGSTLPQADHSRCTAVSAKMQKGDVVANFHSTSSTTVKGKKVTKTTTFAYAFTKLANGKWVIKS